MSAFAEKEARSQDFAWAKNRTRVDDPIQARAEDFAWCEDVIRSNSQSFYRAFSLLPPDKRDGVYAIYAFCRTADDCVDRDGSAARLEELLNDTERFFRGQVADAPLWRALNAVRERFGMDAGPYLDLLEGQRRDLAFRQPTTLADLEDYAYYVAGSVGLMLLPLLHAKAFAPARLRESAVALGVAMQLTNILRDVGEDLDAGRIYLPADVLEAAGVAPDALRERPVGKAFRGAWEAVAHRAEALYRPMERDVILLDEDSRLPTLSSLYLYCGILDAVRADGYACLERRSAVPKARASALVGAAREALRGGAARAVDAPLPAVGVPVAGGTDAQASRASSGAAGGGRRL